MTAVDNHALVAPFAPERDDGDSFIYTELLDRSKRKGNNGFRVLRTFFHRSRAELDEQWPVIRSLCDATNVRACTRLAPRSFKCVGCEFTKLVGKIADRSELRDAIDSIEVRVPKPRAPL